MSKCDIYEEDTSKADNLGKYVTKEIVNSYNTNNLYVDKNNYVYCKNAVDNYIAVTSKNGIQCISKLKDK